MRNPLVKRLPRVMKENLGKYIGMFLILVCTILAGSSFFVTLESTESTLDRVDKESQIEHGQFEIVETVNDSVKDWFKDQKITLVENFYATENEYEGDTKVLIFNEREVLNQPVFFEGGLPEGSDEIAVDRIFAREHKLSIGDKVTLCGRTFTVSGTMALPDYNSLFKSNSDIVMNTKNFGVAVVSKEGFAGFSEEGLVHRYSYRYSQKPEKDSQLRESTEDIQKQLMSQGYTLQSLLTDQTNQSINFLREDMGSDGPTMKVFIFILVAIIAFVFAVLTGNTIEAESTIIGTLRASGYTKFEIIRHYLAPTVIVGLASSIIGNLIGYTIMLKPFLGLYYTTYSVPPIEIQFSLQAFLETTLIPLAIMILINFVMLYHKLSLSPLKFLRKELKKTKNKRPVKLPNVPFIHRFRLRVILQNLGMYVILFVGILLASFLLMFGLGLSPLIDHYVDSVDESLPYEYQYLLKAPVEVEGGEKLETYEMTTWYNLAGKDISVSLMGIEEESKLFDFVSLPEGENEVVLTKPMAQKLKLHKGDTFLLKDSYYDKEHTVKIVDICDYSATMGAFMSRSELNRLLGQDQKMFNCYVSNEKLDISEEYVAKYITRKDMLGATTQMMDSFDVIIKVFDIFSVGIYLILIYILSKTVIERNGISISFLKVFGYNNKEINKVYLNATSIVVIVSLILCVPIEIAAYAAVLDYVAIMMEGYLELFIPWWLYVVIVGGGIVAYFGINAFHVYKIRKIPMSLALKNRE